MFHLRLRRIILFSNPRQENGLMNLYRRTIRWRISIKFRHLLYLELHPIFTGPPHRVQVEANIPSHPEAECAPCYCGSCEPGYGERGFCESPIWWHPGSDDRVSASNSENKS